MTTSQSRRLLTILALLELCVLVALAGSVLRSRGDQDVAIDALLPTNCPGTARVRPKQLRAVNRDVDAELDRLLRELELTDCLPE